MFESEFPPIPYILRRWAEEPDATDAAYTFLINGERPGLSLTYANLDLKARSFAARLQERYKVGDRALLLFSSNSEFIVSFLGCLYAGMVAIPVYPPHPALLSRMLPRVTAILEDSQPDVILVDDAVNSTLGPVRDLIPEFRHADWLVSSEISSDLAEKWHDPGLQPDFLALIQYTSGSTGTPKGVMISQKGISHNCFLIKNSVDMNRKDIGVTWAPVYHDMGLIFGMMVPLYSRFHMIVMDPIDFLKKPSRWLRVISDWKATISCAPNFAYDLAARKTKDSEIAQLDLSSWSLAAMSAEPVRVETMNRFAERFTKCGFDPKAFSPAFGLAEATLAVTTTSPRLKSPVRLKLEAQAFENGNVVLAEKPDGRLIHLVSSGQPKHGSNVQIVDPQTRAPLEDGKIGEIWVHSPSRALGYWKRPEDTARDLEARTANDKGPYLRTGDLGFMRDNELFVTGRLKDLIIANGKNYYPQDIERSIETANAPVRPGCAAVFSVDQDDREKVVAVVEVERAAKSGTTGIARQLGRALLKAVPGLDPNHPVKFNKDDMTKEILNAISLHHDLQIHTLVIVKAGTVPKTSSGKIQRGACRTAFVRGELEALHTWRIQDERTTA